MPHRIAPAQPAPQGLACSRDVIGHQSALKSLPVGPSQQRQQQARVIVDQTPEGVLVRRYPLDGAFIKMLPVSSLLIHTERRMGPRATTQDRGTRAHGDHDGFDVR